MFLICIPSSLIISLLSQNVGSRRSQRGQKPGRAVYLLDLLVGLDKRILQSVNKEATRADPDFSWGCCCRRVWLGALFGDNRSVHVVNRRVQRVRQPLHFDLA